MIRSLRANLVPNWGLDGYPVSLRENEGLICHVPSPARVLRASNTTPFLAQKALKSWDGRE